MPHLLPAAASAIAQAAPAAAATAAKATVMGTLKSVAFNALTSLAISSALSVFSPTVGASARQVEFVIDPDGPIPFAAGRVGVSGSVVHRDTFGPDLMYYGIPFVLSGAGPITAIESFMADDYPMAFDANGGAVTEPYRQELFFRSVLGFQPAPVALSTPGGLKKGATLPGWTGAHKLSGKAAGLIVMAENSKGSAFPTGEIKPLIQLLGLKGWDPTLDSTYPGGDGPCRLNDASTWVTLTCPILWGLKWALGLWEGPSLKGAPAHDSLTDHQVGGIGVRLSGVDVPAFVSASNIAKANSWTVSAYPNTDDDKHQVLETFLQSGGATYAQRAGKISCISRAAPRASLVTISAHDTAGPLEIDTAASRIDRINTIRPRFWSPAHRWQMTALDGEITAASYREEDGGRTRSRGVDWPFVSDAKQVGQLAALQIANTREGIAGVIPLKPHLQRIRPGDAFTITEAGFVLNGLKCLCLNTDYDAATGVVRVSFVSETDAKYPFALGQNPTPPTPQVLTPVDPRYVTPPAPGDWTVTVPGPAPDGSQLPNIDLTGLVSNDTADALLISWRAVASGENPNTPALYLDPDGNVLPGWMDAGSYAPTIRSLTIQGPKSGAVVWLALRYRRGSNFSAAELKGPITVRTLVADVMPNAPGLSQIHADLEAAFGDIFDVSVLVSQARTDIDAQGDEIAAARGGQPNLNSRIVQVNQAIIDGDTSNAQAISLVQARTANTEADIIDLELALATETGARAQAISQVSARQNLLPNRIRNGDFRSGLANYIQSGAGWIVGTAGGPGAAYAFCGADGQQDLWTDYYPVDTNLSFAFMGSRSGANVSLNLVIEWWSETAQVGFGTVTIVPQGGFQRIIVENDVRPATATRFRILARKLGTGGNVAFTLLKVNTGAYATPWSDDQDAKAVQASVTEQALAIIDLENQNALASWSIKAAASGGKPTILQLLSGSFGSSIALTAEQLYFGDNTVFDDATDTIQTVWGSTRKVMAWGAPFGPDNLVEWTGPSNISLGSMTKANAGFWVDQVGAYGPTPLPSFWARVTPTQISRSRIGAGSISTALNDVIVTCYTGTSGATCTWSRVSGDTTISYPSTGFTPVFNTTLAAGQTKTALFVGLVAKGGDVDLVYVNVEFSDNV